MKTLLSSGLILLSAALSSCSTGETAVTGVGNTLGNAAQGIGRTVGTAASGVGNTINKTASAAQNGGAWNAAKAAGEGTTSTVVNTGKSHMKTSRGVLKDTGKTIKDSSEAAAGE